MNNIFEREIMILGEDFYKLKNKKVLVFGIGGVGGHAIETLARCGITTIGIVDNDIVKLSNINRQIIATYSTIGHKKVDVMKSRLIDINPNIIVNKYDIFVNNDNVNLIDIKNYDYVIDCIDTISSKLSIIKICKQFNIPLIVCLGTGNKLDPAKFEINDISKTSYCPLAKSMRNLLRKENIKDVTVLFSKEEAKKCSINEDGRNIPGSIAFTPSVAGILLARHVILNLIK
ncbi:MAG: tRNA threonylcarbamoyladenosine dehydratase [Bacilli bacterium]|nr:tRNA threonylcarbamoyladenosine dehydratase [Bacilli bacterium]